MSRELRSARGQSLRSRHCQRARNIGFSFRLAYEIGQRMQMGKEQTTAARAST
jgi:hypothetical protein